MYSTRSALCFSSRDQQWDSILRRLPAGGGQDPSRRGGALLCPAGSAVALLPQESRAQGGSVSSCGVGLLQSQVSLDLDGSMLKLHFGLQSRLQRFSRLQGGGQKKAVLEKHSSTLCQQATCLLAEPQLHIQAENTHVSEAPCVPVDPWPHGKQADLTPAQENVGYWGQTAANFPPLPQGAQRNNSD